MRIFFPSVPANSSVVDKFFLSNEYWPTRRWKWIFSEVPCKEYGSTSTEMFLWRRGIYDEIRSRISLQGSLNVEQMCQLAQVSRSGFYRYLGNGWPVEEEVNLRSAIQDVVLEHRWRYGYRRVTAELRQCGMIVNHKRVARIMREDNLLTVRREPFLIPRIISRSYRAATVLFR